MNNHYKTVYDHYPVDVKTRGIGDQVTYKVKDHTVVGGFDWRQDKVVNMGGIKLTNMSYFVQDEWKVAPKWTVTPGVRVDHHSAFGTHTSPSISIGYDVNAKLMYMQRTKSISWLLHHTNSLMAQMVTVI